MTTRRYRRISPGDFAPGPVVGVDEVGRGCLAGPVVSAAVYLKSHNRLFAKRFCDSKVLSEARREAFAKQIYTDHIWAIGIASVAEVDRLNIHHASLLSMQRALEGLFLKAGLTAGHVLVDGKFKVPGLMETWQQTPLVQGDSRAEEISAASILAKVIRDRWMQQLAAGYPGYGFEVHKGYGTKLHRQRLDELGPCELHRRSFAGIGESLQGSGAAGSDSVEPPGLVFRFS